eukprot:scaffold465602_cov50-Prasinocladus_malaysianus.AAC.1
MQMKNKFHYDMVLRLRDNSVVVLPFNLHQALIRSGSNLTTSGSNANEASGESCISKPRAVVKACASWEGYPDKAIFVPRQYLRQTLAGPMVLYDTITKHGVPIVNTEQYFKHVLQRQGVP